MCRSLLKEWEWGEEQDRIAHIVNTAVSKRKGGSFYHSEKCRLGLVAGTPTVGTDETDVRPVRWYSAPHELGTDRFIEATSCSRERYTHSAQKSREG